MHIVNVTIAGAATPVGLFYDSAKHATAAVDALFNPLDPHTQVTVTDERGHALAVVPRNVLFCTMIDMKRDLDHQQSMVLVQQEANASLERKMQALAGRGLVVPANGAMLRQ